MLEINSNQVNILNEFRSLVEGIPGFEPFSQETLLAFVNDPLIFSLSFNKTKGNGILYGLDHADLRRKLVNTIPDEIRCDLLFEKLEQAGVFNQPDSPLYSLTIDEIVSVGDIGMGHSVYVVETNTGSWVIKEGVDEHQLFYEKLLTLLDWPTLDLKKIERNGKCFSIFKYLGGQNLNRYTQEKLLDENLEIQLAKQAALADYFGRGDRHFENYMVFEGTLYPIDVSFLFWTNNEDWLLSYIKAGLAEFSYYSLVKDDLFLCKVEAFFEEYKTTSELLKSNFNSIKLLVENFYGDRANDYIQFIKDRLYSDSFLFSQQELYINGLNFCKERTTYKHKLEQVVSYNPSILEGYPYLKMYYLADKGRHSTFFLIEKFERESVFKLIHKLSDQVKENEKIDIKNLTH
ncbi:hypothetical protein DID80_04360 [Candidatus Marinamargulisbacteria bacterium SCGC AAA071-K20]|nr:hypothetical protein DID80_04360 [Candidatus Marinamargulisbacteria bacterium SCGC AAA071-K20]